jgi:hypothetical protein
MPNASLKVVINAPTRTAQPGRGFYQLEEDSLYVPLGGYDANRRFFSFIESPTVRLDFDKTGELLFIEVSLPRKNWRVDDSLTPPKHAAAVDLSWLDFRAQIDDPAILTNKQRSSVCVKFTDEFPSSAYHLAESVIAEVTAKSHVCRIWVTEIVDDVAGREISAFRQRHKSP